MDLKLKVNGEDWALDVAPADVLLDVLRERIGVKSPKIGCERGDCGSCTILMDGRTVRSCLVLAVEVDGHEIMTVEGISYEGFSELQKLFLQNNSFQCGFCAPGIVLAATELLDHNPNPTRHDVQEALAGNLCRCTGYEPIIEAVLAAGDGGSA
ncbi:MAG: (2Fe-2S)-binding protein [Acidimicrobiia bacterium]|nr:(2Fe-2S)-binding protein [Acidimicrobiia bacterium]